MVIRSLPDVFGVVYFVDGVIPYSSNYFFKYMGSSSLYLGTAWDSTTFGGPAETK